MARLNLPPLPWGDERHVCPEHDKKNECRHCIEHRAATARQRQIAKALREWVEMQMKLVGETERGPIMLLIEGFADEIDPEGEADDGRQDDHSYGPGVITMMTTPQNSAARIDAIREVYSWLIDKGYRGETTEELIWCPMVANRIKEHFLAEWEKEQEEKGT